MGGYCYHLPEAFRMYLPEGHDRKELALRDEALRFVARNEPSVIPRLTVNAIMDKSTAGAFVKIITLFQALWFILQCLARMAAGLPLSLLELMTFAHCIVGLVIGWLWLHKPLNISQADPLDIPEAAEAPHWLMAMLYTLSSFDGEEADEDRYKRMGSSVEEKEPGCKEEAGGDSCDQTLVEEDSGHQVFLEPVGQHSPIHFGGLDLDASSPARPSTGRSVTGKSGRAGPSTASRPGTEAGHSSSPKPEAGTSLDASLSSQNSLLEQSSTGATADANLQIRCRMKIAQKGWEHYVLNPSTSRDTTTAAPDQDRARTTQRRLKRAFRNTLVDRVPNFPRRRHSSPHDHDPDHDPDHPPRTGRGGSSSSSSSSALHRQHTLRTHLGTTLTGFLYGGLHLLAWNASFNTGAESVLWRVAALSLAASGLLVPVTHAQGVVSRVVRPWVGVPGNGEGDEEDEEAEEGAAYLAEMARTMGHWRGGWRRRCWRVYRWCFLRMMEVSRVVKVLLIVGVAVVYFGLRLFIFVECLVNLAHLQPSAYDVVRWSQYFPHIG